MGDVPVGARLFAVGRAGGPVLDGFSAISLGLGALVCSRQPVLGSTLTVLGGGLSFEQGTSESVVGLSCSGRPLDHYRRGEPGLVGQPGGALIAQLSDSIAVVGGSIPFVAEVIAQRGGPVALIGYTIAVVGGSVAIVAEAVAQRGDLIALVSRGVTFGIHEISTVRDGVPVGGSLVSTSRFGRQWA